jgi:tetratricopeptide (TPR) repeat protein
MKIKFVIIGAVGLFSNSVFAQKSELATAQKEYEAYETLTAGKSMASMANASLTKAKASIDLAAANEKTSALPQTYALKAVIYSIINYTDSTNSAATQKSFDTAKDALVKAKSTDTKGEFKNITDRASTYLANAQIRKGAKDYEAKRYDDAYKAFDYYRSTYPEDTTGILYTGLAAASAKNYPVAISNYKKLLTTNYSKNADIYYDLSNHYLSSGDTTGALNAVTEGVSKFPSNSNLRGREVELALHLGKQTEFIGKIEAAVANNPKDKNLLYYQGFTYTQLGDAQDAAVKSAKSTPASKATALKTRGDYYDKAAEAYKKAIELDPNYFNANMNLGYVLMKTATEDFNAANKLPTTKQKEYNAMIAKVNIAADKAKPYLEKAVELDPKSMESLVNLRNYYIIKKDTVKTAEVKKRIDALSSNSK